MLNQTTWLQRMLRGNRPPEQKQDEVIQAAQKLKNLQKHPGWKLIAQFMETQRLGGQQYLQKEATNINLFSLVWLGNTFIKYLGVLLEARAYNRIDNYIKLTIMKGDQYARDRVKQEERATRAGNGRVTN